MQTFAKQIRSLRIQKKIPLRIVAGNLDIDPAILSKIENGKRVATREQVRKLAEYFDVPAPDMMALWLAGQWASVSEEDDVTMKALQLAEEQVAYRVFKKLDRKNLIDKLITCLKQYSKIQKAWIYGSFSRGDDGPGSDIDIALKTDEDFSYFDLAEVQHQLEIASKRKIDVGFIDSFKSYIFEHIQPDLKTIYERPS
jgi:predicted nucleotidyltransferase